MLTFSPRRRFLILPAWCWAAVCLGFVLIAWSMGPAIQMEEPSEIAQMFGPTVYVTRDGDSFRVVPVKEVATTAPVWAVGRNKFVQSFITYKRVIPVVPDLYFQECFFRYGLYTEARGDHWTPGRKDPKTLSPRETASLHPVLINDLNSRYPDEHRGDRLGELLQNGSWHKSWTSRQNWVTFFALFSMAISVAATISMFVPVRKRESKPEPVGTVEIAVAQ